MLEDLQLLLVRDLEALAREISLFPDDESVWSAPPGVTNASGTLVQHVCGNLKHYVGAVLGGTGYVRDREMEFNSRTASREELLAELASTIDVIDEVVPTIPVSVLESPFPEKVGGIPQLTRTFLVHLTTHLAFHMGQVGYLRRILTGENVTSGAVSVKPIAIKEELD